MLSFLRLLARLIVALLILVPVAAGLLLLSTAPEIAEPPAPDAATAALNRGFGQRVGDLVSAESDTARLDIPVAELEAALVTLNRLASGVRGSAEADHGQLTLRFSLQPDRLPEPLWINGAIGIGDSTSGVELTGARIGRLPIPRAMLPWLTGLAAKVFAGGEAGPELFEAVSEVSITPTRISVGFREDGEDRGRLFARIKALARQAAGGGDTGPIWVHLWYLGRATDRAELPASGSVLPYLRFTVARAIELAEDADPGVAQMKSALLALAINCGDSNLGHVIGVVVAKRRQSDRNACSKTTLSGRGDLRQHFTVSAGLEAARSGRVALGLGELKELLDSNAGGSGFSFDDMAANVSGIRFAAALLAAPKSEWPAYLDRMQSEADILPSLEGLPSGLSAAEFQDRYGDVGSEGYEEVLAEINRRVDATPFHSAIIN